MPYTTIVKTLYLKPLFDKDLRTGKIDKIREDALFAFLAHSDGRRETRIMRKPKYTFFLAKENGYDYHRLSAPMSDLTPINCPYDKRHDFMAEAVGLKDEYVNAKKDWQIKRDWIQNNLYNHPRLYKCDIDIEEDFKMRFNDLNGDNSSNIEYYTSFTDIEARADLGDFNQHKAEVPICSICHVDSRTETIYVNVLNDNAVPEIKQLFSNLPEFLEEFKILMQNVRQECIDKIIKEKGNPNSIHSFNFKYKFYLFEKEADLIRNYFKIINETKPDFCGIWNINFDMIMIKNRAEKLGLNMADLVSDDLVPPEYRYFMYSEDPERYRKDKASANHYSRFFDKILSSSHTTWYCQMSLHSNLRKRFLETDYKLNTIGSKYAHMRKFDLESDGYDIKDVYVKNFRVFLKYAMIDPIVQFMIERANGDIPRHMVGCKDTSFYHGIRKTYAIKNELANYLKSKNEVIGNNVTYDIEEKIPGAIIAAPQNIEEKGSNILGIDTHIYRNCADFDVSSEYPTIIITYGVLKTTNYGRIISICLRKVINGAIVDIPISHGSDFNKMLQTIDSSIFDLGVKYYGLPSVDELVSMIENGAIKK